MNILPSESVFPSELPGEVPTAIDVVYLDFSKAFDKVPHRRLVKKFKAHRIAGKVLGWVQAWLNCRQQRTISNGNASDWADVDSSVLQGFVFWPLAFVIYINDIENMTRLITIMNKLWAGDHEPR